VQPEKPPDDLVYVQLFDAYEWTCPTCNVLHFVRAVPVEAYRDDGKKRWRRWPTGSYEEPPMEVTCPTCDKTFPVDFDEE
jgi:rubredoxin